MTALPKLPTVVSVAIHSTTYSAEQGEATGAITSILDTDGAMKGAAPVVNDECSQIYGDLRRDLMPSGRQIFALGDPLPSKGRGFFTGHEPDQILTEIHLPAEHNPIVRRIMRRSRNSAGERRV